MRFLDTNVILRYLTRDGRSQGRGLLPAVPERQERGEELFTCEAIVTEVVYVLSSPRAGYRLSHDDIRARLVPILSLRGLRLLHKRVYVRALDIYASFPSLDFEDALAVAHIERQGITEIVSYDRDFDRVVQVQRTEP